REGGLAELDVAAARILPAAYLAELRRGVAAHRLLHLRLDGLFGGVRELKAVAREELDAVILVRIVRRADHHARGNANRAREVRHRRRRDRTAHVDVDARRREAGLERGLDHVARDARVLADEHGRMRTLPGQHLAGCIAELHDEFRRHGRLADRAANPVSAEVFASHDACTASQMATTSFVSLTSWTLSILAPPCSASKAMARLPARRSSAARPVIRPMVDLRDSPATSGTPKSM